MKRQYADFLNGEKWMEIPEPAGLQDRIMNHIDRRIYRRMNAWNVFRFATVPAFAACAVLAAALLVNVLRPTRVVLVYPNAPNIDSVEIVGTFGRVKKTIPMVLDEEQGIWRAEIISRTKYVDDYSIRVYEVEENGDDTSI